MGKPRVIWNKNMELFVLDLWSEKFYELQGTKKNGHIYSEMIAAFNQKFDMKEITKWDLQVKIHNLCQRYRQERKLVLASSIEASTWPYYERIHKLFIKDHKKNIKDINSLDTNTTNVSVIKSSNEKDNWHIADFENGTIVELQKMFPIASPEQKNKSYSTSPEKIIIRSPKTIKQYKNRNLSKKLNTIKQLHRHTEITNYEKPYDQFGKYIAAELRQLPNREAILLQQELQNSIIRIKLSCLERLHLNNSNNKVQNNNRSYSTSSSCFNTPSTTMNDDSTDLDIRNQSLNQELVDKFIEIEK